MSHTLFVLLRDGTYVGLGVTLKEAATAAGMHRKAQPMVYRIDTPSEVGTELLEFRRGRLCLKAGTEGRVRKWGPYSPRMTEEAPELSLAQRSALKYLNEQGRAVHVGYTVQRSTATTLDEMGLVRVFPGANRGFQVEPTEDGRAYPF